jgi:diaminopimelate epimerase
MGNPHCVFLVDSLNTAPVAALGQLLNQHPQFPAGVNVGFMHILDPTHIELRVYERGAGETKACGSGACAAVVAGGLLEKLNHCVKVHLLGGDLTIESAGPLAEVIMTGPASYVFQGEITL